jgi:hypothetical protein
MPQQGIENGHQIMADRLRRERKEELEKTLKKDKRFVVCITSKFEGTFIRFEDGENGEPMAVFHQDGKTDRGSTPIRRVKASQIMSIGQIKT